MSLLMQLLLSFDYDSHYLILLLLLFHSNRSIYFYLSIDAKNKLLKVSLIAQTKLSLYSSLAIAIHYFSSRHKLPSNADVYRISCPIQTYAALLIFDCHGGIDKDTLSSYLILDEKNMVYLTKFKFKITIPVTPKYKKCFH